MCGRDLVLVVYLLLLINNLKASPKANKTAKPKKKQTPLFPQNKHNPPQINKPKTQTRQKKNQKTKNETTKPQKPTKEKPQTKTSNLFLSPSLFCDPRNPCECLRNSEGQSLPHHTVVLQKAAKSRLCV